MIILLRIALAAVFFSAAALRAQAGQLNTNPDSMLTQGFDSNPQAAVQDARGRVAAGDLPAAIRGLAVYVAAHPKDVAPARLLGDLYYRQGKLDQAKGVYDRIIMLYPNDRETHNRLGAVYATQNRVDDAITEYNKSLPGTDSIGDLVAMHTRKGDLPQYRVGVEREAMLYPSDADRQHELGAVFLALHDPSNALRYFLRELDVAPASLLGLNHAAIAYMDLGEYQKATNLLTRCLSIDPTNFACLVNMAAGDLEQGRYAHGKSLLDRAQSLEPEHPEIMVNYGYLADAQGDWKTAVTDYVKALAISPYSRDAYLDLGLDYEQHRLYELAESALLKGLTVAPADGALHYMLGRVYQDQQKRDLAVQQLQAASTSDDPRVTLLAKLRMSQMNGTTH